MALSKRTNTIAAIDVGTTKICAIVGRRDEGGALKILGHGFSESQGLRKGVVVNLAETVRSIRRSVDEAEARAEVPIQRVYVGVGGAHVRGCNGTGAVEVRGKNNEICDEDILASIDEAKRAEISPDQEIVHVLPQDFTVDSQQGIENPVGMVGHRLQANIHVVTSSAAITQNLVNAVNKAGMAVIKTVMQQLASGEAILSRDEKDLGAIVLDIGGGTTDLAYYRDGGIWHSEAFPIGGGHFTRDIAVGLRTPIGDAEQLKRSYGCAVATMVPREEMVEVPGVGGRDPRTVQRELLCEIIQARAEEMLNLIAHSIRRCTQDGELVGGVVLAGGGALLEGIDVLAERIFKVPVRVGYPVGLEAAESELCNPIFATAVGLLLFGSQQPSSLDRMVTSPPVPSGLLARSSSRMRGWLYQLLA
ncbi:MAG: cell division protein FtsA [Acidobacteriota bacterium]